MTSEKKDYPIIEALCEFRFTKNKEWDWTIPGAFYERVRKEFPIKKQELVTAVVIDGNTKEIKPSTDTHSIEKMRFLREDESALLQIAPHLLVVNQLKPYPGWALFKKLILENIKIYTEITEPTGMERIGLRYINRFNIEDLEEDILKDFYIKPQVPIERPIKNFFMRNELEYEEIDSSLIITLANQYDHDLKKFFVFLDFDIFSVNKTFISFSNYGDWLEKAHLNLDEAYKSCLSDILRYRFEGVKL